MHKAKVAVGALVLFAGEVSASPLDTVPPRIIVQNPVGSAAEIGSGLISATLAPSAGYCIKGNHSERRINSNNLSFRQATDNSNFSDTLNISAHGRYYGTSGSANYSRTVTLNESDTNIAAYGYVQTREEFVTSAPGFPRLGQQMSSVHHFASNQLVGLAPTTASVAPLRESITAGDTGVSLNADARRWLRRSLKDFRNNCGDYFVAGIIHGGSFYGRLTAHDTSRSMREEMSGSISGSYGFADFSVSTSHIVQSLVQNNRFQFDLNTEGAALGTNPTDTNQFIQFVQNYPSTVTNSDRPIALVLQAYSSLPDYQRYSNKRPAAIDAIVNQYLRYDHLRRNAATMKLPNSNYVFLGRLTRDTVASFSDVLNTYMNILGDSVTSCENNIEQCSYPAVPRNDYLARLEMPIPAADWPWTDRRKTLETSLAAHQARLNLLLTYTGFGALIARNEIGQLQSAIPSETQCRDWLTSAELNMYIRARVQRWLDDAYRARSETSDAARRELTNAELQQMLAGEFTKEHSTIADIPVLPSGCGWTL